LPSAILSGDPLFSSGESEILDIIMVQKPGKNQGVYE